MIDTSQRPYDGSKRPEPPPAPPHYQSDPELEYAGLRFKASEVKNITIQRDGKEIYIERKEPVKRMGFGQ